MRNFASLLTALSGLIMAVSGTVLYVVPEGRIAYWTDWRLTGLGKEQWGAVHTILSFVFFCAAVVHAVYNGRALMAYLRDRFRRTVTLRRELAAALLLTALCVTGSVAGYAPFAGVMQLGKAAKKTWHAGQDVHPPFPHAELMTLRQLAQKLDLSLAGALAHLREQGIEKADGDTTLKQLAGGSGRSPAELFEAMMMDDRLYR